jgi:hypothetical protein
MHIFTVSELIFREVLSPPASAYELSRVSFECFRAFTDFTEGCVMGEFVDC